ncbi:MAG: GAF domain-containing protein [Acidobacteriota bacterium]
MTESSGHKLPNKPNDLYKITGVIADTASDAIISIDEESTILFINRAAEGIFGYTRAELIGQSLTILMPEYLRHVHHAGLERYVATGARHISWEAVELPGLHKDGREIPLELSLGEFVEDGRRFFTGIARDITERRKLERRLSAQFHVARILAESDSLPQAGPLLLQSISEGLGWDLGQMWVVDRDGEVMRWLAAWRLSSPAAEEFENASRSRTFLRGVGLPGRVWESRTSDWISDISTEPNLPRGVLAVRAGFRSAFASPILLHNQVSGVMEFFSRDSQPPDQTLLDMMSGIGNQIGQFVARERGEEERIRLLDCEQRARHEVEVAMDRMARVQTVTEVALSHLSLDRLLAELLDRVRDAMDVDTVVIMLLEEDSDLVAWATKGLELDVGIRVPVGAGFAGRVAEQKSPIVIDDIDTAELHTPFLRERGVKSLLGVPLLLEGRVLGVVHVGRLVRRPFTDDDTRLLQLVAFRIALAVDNARLFEEERAARQEAEAASRAKDEFLTTISHELRTPLTPVIGWIHMIRNGILPEKETEHGMAVIEKNSQALKRLINDLLDMSAILTGKMRMEQVPVSLGDIVSEAVETVRPLAAARDIQLEVTFHDWQNEIVSGDRARLVQVFWNLLSNALKFSAPGDRVKVDCQANSHEAVVTIEDTGQGITEEFLPYVFDRFRQADGSKTRAHGGLGLGLALVKSFVEAHKGTVQAASGGLDRGSSFRVSLPRQQPLAAVPARPIQTAKRPGAPTARLIVVEDDPDTLEMLKATLEARGFSVTTCESAAEMLECAEQTNADLIISDIGMPEVDGFEMIRQLREIKAFKDVPAIALSGYASEKDAETAIAAGFNAHVSKPVDPTELLTLVAGLLQKAPER